MFNEALLGDDATRLNNLAWAALTGEDWRETSGLDYSVPFDQIRDMCLDASLTACEMTKFENWWFLDTLAQICWKRGEAQDAARYMKQAVELAPEGRDRRSMETLLELYQAKLPKASAG